MGNYFNLRILEGSMDEMHENFKERMSKLERCGCVREHDWL
jgi:hypothetical protein